MHRILRNLRSLSILISYSLKQQYYLQNTKVTAIHTTLFLTPGYTFKALVLRE